MNPEKQRIAIAEFCGFKWSTPHYGHDGIWHSTPYSGTDFWADESSAWAGKPHDVKREVDRLPDYLNDLNAMHEAEKRLEIGFDGSQADDYQQALYSIVNPGRDFIEDFSGGVDVVFIQNIILATAAQRAEALLRTIGKWQDGTALKTEVGS